jgi:diguanylate cyclase (GGDEF)-like protein
MSSNSVAKAELTFVETRANGSPEEIRRSLRRIEQHDWWLWGYAVIIILSLTATVVALSVSVLTKPDEPFFQFHISQAVRGLVGVVLLFNIYTFYQQIQLKRLRSQLTKQIEIAAEQHMRAEEFLKLAMLDPLTDLHNRRFAQERLAAEIARSQRHGHALTVLLLDLDEFKRLNDFHGHFAGDLALKEFARRLSRAIRGSDLAVRLGGDEFLVLLPECKLGDVQAVLARLQPLEIGVNGAKVSFTFSAGWTDYQPGESPEQLLQRADHALYSNKHSRKNSLNPVL